MNDVPFVGYLAVFVGMACFFGGVYYLVKTITDD